ncbi:hypothetical protein B6A10_13430 [Flavobacterium sp. L1I52]|uniref:Uncharacterized protein n=1 Tax=Flavobacterium pokkalii TaxID=1940408 RepID=A0ABR7UTE0_9FLAO|nr:hypothetical protein [Flavobacterium pokkalii]MBD0726176.1 hypothetical protein [Flavobacterium pokkalii]
MRTIVLIAIFLNFYSFSAFGTNNINTALDTIRNKKECFIKELTLKTERIEKPRKFIFWKLAHKKVNTIDRIIDTKGKVILKKSSIQICSSDACGDRKFRRIKIVGNEIWIFKYNRNPEKGIIKHYNFCKRYLVQKIWDDENFNDY